jgi:hypothetical protein
MKLFGSDHVPPPIPRVSPVSQRPAVSVIEVTIEGDPDDVTTARCELLRESQKVFPIILAPLKHCAPEPPPPPHTHTHTPA